MMLFEKDGEKIDPSEFVTLEGNQEIKVTWKDLTDGGSCDFDREKCKKFVYYMNGKKLKSECIDENGEKKYSSEIGIDIVETLVEMAKKVNERFTRNDEQQAEDDNNF